MKLECDLFLIGCDFYSEDYEFLVTSGHERSDDSFIDWILIKKWTINIHFLIMVVFFYQSIAPIISLPNKSRMPNPESEYTGIYYSPRVQPCCNSWWPPKRDVSRHKGLALWESCQWRTSNTVIHPFPNFHRASPRMNRERWSLLCCSPNPVPRVNSEAGGHRVERARAVFPQPRTPHVRDLLLMNFVSLVINKKIVRKIERIVGNDFSRKIRAAFLDRNWSRWFFGVYETVNLNIIYWIREKVAKM